MRANNLSGLALALACCALTGPSPSLAATPSTAPDLPGFTLEPDSTSVSGLSSGAFMAVQLQVAYSASIRGAGVVAGGPYYCAAGQLAYTGICMGQVPLVPPNAALMAAAARRYASLKQIDATSHLAQRRLYVFRGTADSVVGRSAVDATVSFFQQMGVPDSQVRYVHDIPAGHALITPTFGNACSANAAPYISHCEVHGHGYDQSGELLAHILGPLQPRATSLAGKLLTFRQRTYAPADTGMADNAFLYVPPSCAAGQPCRVHVALHGCQQSADQVGKDFVADTGYNEWAEHNRLLVLYPQVNASTRPYNPKGCWDWWGYTGSAYATRNGAQMKAIRAMVDALGRAR
ncbi:extracellular catalytic domain type 2 short-chain-length polyhydroxyalkanoate depolymerase [Sphaerotilus sp.]|uniref:extracellular catalytic domain type 2 short-chain-length polyhydroxyalkanoate depolymerase n=1 Tax=Sphaerotilus sp. TaxID=2093942 RepID=UPI0025D2CDBF|nr:PHB depolymerase family esterase [Sphaerotilus sp.]